MPSTHRSLPSMACLLAAVPLLVGAPQLAGAQAAPDNLQSRYDAALARCNGGTLPAPERQACIRDAGAALDRQRGGLPVDASVDSNDGRATIVTPIGSTAPVGGDTTLTTGDGRAVVVVPADRGR